MCNLVIKCMLRCPKFCRWNVIEFIYNMNTDKYRQVLSWMKSKKHKLTWYNAYISRIVRVITKMASLLRARVVSLSRTLSLSLSYHTHTFPRTCTAYTNSCISQYDACARSSSLVSRVRLVATRASSANIHTHASSSSQHFLRKLSWNRPTVINRTKWNKKTNNHQHRTMHTARHATNTRSSGTIRLPYMSRWNCMCITMP